MFRDDIEGSGGSGKREVSLAEVAEFLREAEEKHLVTRPFRDEGTRTRVDGICFCCDDCCGYFLGEDEPCDKGDLIEKTDMGSCTHCGACADVCYFGARQMRDGELAVDREKCYGCGLCVDVCPVECVEMVRRK
jgi:ferredoxin